MVYGKRLEVLAWINNKGLKSLMSSSRTKKGWEVYYKGKWII